MKDTLLARKLKVRIDLDEKLLAYKQAAERDWRVVPSLRINTVIETHCKPGDMFHFFFPKESK